MTEMETKIEAEAPDFTDELIDEALDRTEGEFTGYSINPGRCSSPFDSPLAETDRLGSMACARVMIPRKEMR